jgi:hypothetical protein
LQQSIAANDPQIIVSEWVPVAFYGAQNSSSSTLGLSMTGSEKAVENFRMEVLKMPERNQYCCAKLLIKLSLTTSGVLGWSRALRVIPTAVVCLFLC